MGGEGGFEAFGHEGEAGGLEGGDFVAAEGAGGGVGELEGEAGAGFSGEQAEELLAVFESGEVGVVAGLDVEVGVEDVGEDFFGLVGGDGAEVGTDGEALGAVLVAGGAGALVDGVAALGIAAHEAGHAIVSINEPASDPIHKATIIPRGRALGMVMRLPERDNYSYHRDKMYANLSVAMGGRVAEELIFGYDKVSSGASSDIQYATGLARDMVTRWGMSDVLGPLQYAEADEEVFLG